MLVGGDYVLLQSSGSVIEMQLSQHVMGPNHAIKEEGTQPGKVGQEGQEQLRNSSDSGNVDPGSPSCTHMNLPEGRTVEDFKDAYELF
ncbi:hypothetical protein ACHAXN_001895 [Cyclotella atomus]